MNERIKELAVQSGFAFSHDYDYWVAWDTEIERFAELVEAAARKDEREACAKLCEEQDEYGCGQYAKAIRGRTT
jgi:hypothetical protein